MEYSALSGCCGPGLRPYSKNNIDLIWTRSTFSHVPDLFIHWKTTLARLPDKPWTFFATLHNPVNSLETRWTLNVQQMSKTLYFQGNESPRRSFIACLTEAFVSPGILVSLSDNHYQPRYDQVTLHYCLDDTITSQRRCGIDCLTPTLTPNSQDNIE